MCLSQLPKNYLAWATFQKNSSVEGKRSCASCASATHGCTSFILLAACSEHVRSDSFQAIASTTAQEQKRWDPIAVRVSGLDQAVGNSNRGGCTSVASDDNGTGKPPKDGRSWSSGCCCRGRGGCQASRGGRSGGWTQAHSSQLKRARRERTGSVASSVAPRGPTGVDLYGRLDLPRNYHIRFLQR
jgi:hypothetical protein